MDRRTVSLDDGSLRFRYFGKFQCGIAVFYYFLCGFAVFGPSLRPPHPLDFLKLIKRLAFRIRIKIFSGRYYSFLTNLQINIVNYLHECELQ